MSLEKKDIYYQTGVAEGSALHFTCPRASSNTTYLSAFPVLQRGPHHVADLELAQRLV